ncbi:hypothetical protein GOP47_0021022 [Adiantum capillus-veneris]|uniref:Uncharacterized protein n=1 Tax=Adiantum capillus-veneris TaxID=13818 RepID=A0A9D4UAP3_ADICA|nr:hypothetical protein GOP47_0021022 [Adiantum capillus-veneris]
MGGTKAAAALMNGRKRLVVAWGTVEKNGVEEGSGEGMVVTKEGILVALGNREVLRIEWESHGEGRPEV